MKSNKFFYFVLLVSLFCIAIFLYMNINKEEEEKYIDLSKHLFFGTEDSIHSYDIDNEEKLVWTQNNIDNVQKIDEYHIGFSKSYEFENEDKLERKYRIMTYNTKTEKLETLSKLTDYTLLNFYSPNKFAYSTTNWFSKDNTQDSHVGYYEIFLYENEGKTKIASEKMAHAGGGFPFSDIITDNTYRVKKLEFSPNGEFLFYHQPTNFLSVEPDKNIYIYGLYNDFKSVISNASIPNWLDNESIIYANTANIQDSFVMSQGLSTYNLETKEIKEKDFFEDKKISSLDVLHPERKILYNEGKGEDENASKRPIFIYDLESNESKQVIDDGWGGTWINPDKFLFYKISQEGIHDSYQKADTLIFDLNKDKKQELPQSVQENILIF